METEPLKICKYGDEVLKVKAAEIRDITGRILELAASMTRTMHLAPGIGLAAPQVGESLQLITVDLSVGENPEELLIVINPRIVAAEGHETSEEGCLSVPGYRGLVTRATQVTIKGQDVRGHAVRYRAEGLLAQAFQHELDHLDGVLYIDHIEGPSKFWRIEPEPQSTAEPQVTRAE